MRAGAAGVCQNAASESRVDSFNLFSNDGVTGVDGVEGWAGCVLSVVCVTFERGLDFDKASFCCVLSREYSTGELYAPAS